jgi:transforming growth factor-beta-induced protein
MRSHLLAAATILFFISPSFAQSSAPSLEDVLQSTENLTTFRDVLTTQLPELLANLSSQEQSQQYVTLLAPSDEAFERLGDSSIGQAFGKNDTDVIRNVINYHIIPGDHQDSTVTQSFAFLPTRLNEEAYSTVTGGQRLGFVKQGDSELIIVSGGGTRSLVIAKDIFFAGGVMHVIDFPVLPPESLIQAAVPFNLTGFLGAYYQDLFLNELINQASDLTLFVPNNLAFERVGSTVISIDKNSLTSLIYYHIIVGQRGPFYTSSFSNGTTYRTLQGQSVTIRQASNSNFVNGARMLQTDLLFANGVMHVIDNVLNPNATAGVPDPAVGTQAPALPGSSLADTPFTDIIPSLTSTVSFTSTRASTATGGSSGTRRTSSIQSSSTSQSTATGASPRIVGDGTGLMAFMLGSAAAWLYV